MPENLLAKYPLGEWVVEVGKDRYDLPKLVASDRLDEGTLKCRPTLARVLVQPSSFEDVIFNYLGMERLVSTPEELAFLIRRWGLPSLPDYFQAVVFEDWMNITTDLVKYGAQIWQSRGTFLDSWREIEAQYCAGLAV